MGLSVAAFSSTDDDVPDECQRIARRAVDLRGTAHRVGILDASAVGVGRVDRAAGEEGADDGGGLLLATERTRRVDPRIERLRGSSQAVDRERRGDVGCMRDALGVEHSQRQDRGRGWVPLMSASPSFGLS